MKIRSLRSNFVLNAIRILSSALIAIGMMPYINRTVGVQVIGNVEYVLSIVNYFVLFSALGIPIYGIREIARVRDNVHERTKVFLELFVILTITTLVAYAILFSLIVQTDFLSGYRTLVIILGSLIFLTNIGTEWYFQGVENQLYITVRTVCVRIIGFLLIIFFVKGPEDEFIYATILLFILGGANLLNMFHLLQVMPFKFHMLQSLNLRRHLTPIFTVFFAAVSINIYLHLDKILIGSIKGSSSVGYYTVANKIVRFIIELITVIGMVMLPRLSKLFVTDIEQYKKYVLKAFYVIMMIALPFSTYLFVFSAEIIEIMAGNEFKPSVIAMQILSPLCLVVGIAYFCGYLILYTQNKEKIYTSAVVISAVFSIIVNYHAIRNFDFVGAAVVAVISEIIAIIIMIFLMNKSVVNVNVWTRNFFKIMGINLIMVFLFAFYYFISAGQTNILHYLVASIVFFSLYLLLLYIFSEETTMEQFQFVKKMVKGGK